VRAANRVISAVCGGYVASFVGVWRYVASDVCVRARVQVDTDGDGDVDKDDELWFSTSVEGYLLTGARTVWTPPLV
jgi:hypothetical protein